MGNKSSHLDKGRRHIDVDEQPISLMSSSSACFGIKGSWKSTAILGVLDSLFHIPCLCECILSADIDTTCQRADRTAILELQLLFDKRAKASSGSIISADQFMVALTASQLEGDTNDFDQDDPGQVYDAISSLIITTLPELRGIFLRDKHIRDLAPTSKDAAGICITLPPHPDALNLEVFIRDKFLSKAKNLQASPVFVVTTTHTSPRGSKKSSLAFPHVLNMKENTDSSASLLVYNLQSVIVETESGPHSVKSFYLTASTVTWYESGSPTSVTTIQDILDLDSPDSPYRVRVLIYIQLDLSMKISTGFKFSTTSSESKHHQSHSTTTLTLQQSPSDHNKLHNTNIPNNPSIKPSSSGSSHTNKHEHVLSADESDDRMNEDIDSEDYDSEDDEDDDEDGEEEYGDIDGLDYPEDDGDEEYDDDEEDSGVCQCQTCRRDREMKLAAERTRMELEAIERAKQEKQRRQLIMKTPGTRSVPFQRPVLERGERILSDGKYLFKTMFMQTITGMDGYNSKSLEELRFEDYCNDNPKIKEVKKKLDSEILDRIREATNRIAMEKEEKNMKIWAKAADRAWKKYLYALSQFNKEDVERDQAAELFTQTLKLCISGPHSAECYYHRALCNHPHHLAQVQNDCESALNIQPKHAKANYLLGSVLLKGEIDYEKAELYLERAYKLDRNTFATDASKIRELLRAQFMAANQRRINAAETKKLAGNNAMSKGDYIEAERMYSAAIEIAPSGDNSHIYYSNRAVARCELGMKNESNPINGYDMLMLAIEDCDVSLSLQPGYPKALFRKSLCQGVASFYQEHLDQALSYLNTALELDPSSALVKQEIRKVTITVDVLKAKDKALEIEREIAAREALRAEEKEKERRILAEKKAKDEQARKEKAEKLEKEKAERSRLKSERDQAKAERDKALAEEKLREKEKLRLEKEKEKAAKELEKSEEREKKRLEKEKDRERLKLEKEKQERELLETREKQQQQRTLDLSAKEASKVLAASVSKIDLNNENKMDLSLTEPSVTAIVTAAVKEVATSKSSISTSTLKLEPVRSYDDDNEEDILKVISSAKQASFAANTREESLVTSSSNLPVASATIVPTPSPKPRSVSNNVNSIAMIAKSIASTSVTPKSSSTTSVGMSSATIATSSAKTTASTPVVEKSPHTSTAIVVKYMDCPQAKVGLVIGAKGSIINEMMRRTGCKMCINQDYPDGHPRKVVYTGTIDQIDEAKVLVAAVIVHGPNVLSSPDLIAEVAAVVKAGHFNPMTAATPAAASAVPTASTPKTSAEQTNQSNDDNNFSKYTADAVLHEVACKSCSSSNLRNIDKLFAMGSCNHIETCSLCFFKKRIFAEDKTCSTCHVPQEHVVCSPSQHSKFSDFNIPNQTPSDYFYHAESRMYFPKLYYHNVISSLRAFTCRECSSISKDFDSYKSHYQNIHGLVFCELCAVHKKTLPLEYPLYSPAEYEAHVTETSRQDSNELHPICLHCKIRFYDKSLLMEHISTEHAICQICPRDNNGYLKYLKDEKMLGDHLRRDHFACDELECLQKGNIAFKSLFELQAHKRAYHSEQATPISSTSNDSYVHESYAGQQQQSFNPLPSHPNIMSEMHTNLVQTGLKGFLNSNSNDSISAPLYSQSYNPLSLSGGIVGGMKETRLSGLPPNQGMSSGIKISQIAPSAPRNNVNFPSNYPNSANSRLFGLHEDYSNQTNQQSVFGLSALERNGPGGDMGKSILNSGLLPETPVLPPTSHSNSHSRLGINQYPGMDDSTGIANDNRSLGGGLFGNSDQFSGFGSSASNSLGNLFASESGLNQLNQYGSLPNKTNERITSPNLLDFSSDSSILKHSLSNLGNPPGSSKLMPDFSNNSPVRGKFPSAASNSLLENAGSGLPSWMSFSSTFGLLDDMSDSSSGLNVNEMDFASPFLPNYSGSDNINNGKSVSDNKPVMSGISMLSALGGHNSMEGFGSTSLPYVDNSLGKSLMSDVNFGSGFNMFSSSGLSSDPNSAQLSNMDSSLHHVSNSSFASSSNGPNSLFDMNLNSFSLGQRPNLSLDFMGSSSLSGIGGGSKEVESSHFFHLHNNTIGEGHGNGSGIPPLSSETHSSDSNSWMGEGEDSSDSINIDGLSSTLQNSSDDRSLLPRDTMTKLIEVLRSHPDGILAAQVPEAFRKMHSQKLVVESAKGRKLKLSNVLDGHPNVRKTTSGTSKLFYQEASSSNNNFTGVATMDAGCTDGSSDHTKSPPGIEIDLLPSGYFPVAAWLGEYNMHMYRWSGNNTEWTQYALRLRPEMLNLLDAYGEAQFESISKKTGCTMSMKTEKLHGNIEKFLVFKRGSEGSEFNAPMNTALDYVCQMFKRALSRGEIFIADGSNDDIDDEDMPSLPSMPSSSGESRDRHTLTALGQGRYQRVLDIPQSAVGLIAGKLGKKLFAMRKKSGAYMSLVSKLKSTMPAKLTISGTAESVEVAISLVRAALADKDVAI